MAADAAISIGRRAAVFGRRNELPPPESGEAGFRPAPERLAYALRHEEPGTVRRLVLERLYRNLTPGEQRLCDAERARTAGAS